MSQASTKLFAVLGEPVTHSLSPSIQNPAFEAAGVDGVYVALRCTSEGLGGLMRGIAHAGGGGNVTLPHKEAAAALVDEPSDLVERTGACNTFWSSEGRLRGDNTDVAGFQGAVRSLLGKPPVGSSALLLGAGGAARAAIVALMSDGIGAVAVWNRTAGRAEELARELGEDRTRVIRSEGELGAQTFDLIVNSTSLGLRADDPMPLDLRAVQRPGAILDLVYRANGTALVREARSLEIPAADGGEMLVRQGAEAFERWWDRPAPLEAMFRALDQARRGPQDGIQPG